MLRSILQNESSQVKRNSGSGPDRIAGFSVTVERGNKEVDSPVKAFEIVEPNAAAFITLLMKYITVSMFQQEMMQ